MAKASRCTAGAARTTGDRQGERLRTLLVAAQIAMTLVLLISAGLLIHSFVRLTSVSPGFDTSGRDGVVQTVRVTLPERLYDGPDRIHAFARGVLDGIQVPAWRDVRQRDQLGAVRQDVHPGRLRHRGSAEANARYRHAEDRGGLFTTMGIPLLAGRDFTARDTADAPKVAIVSERIVREYFPAGPGDALGRRVRLASSALTASG